MTRHTPGPWRIETTQHGGRWTVRIKGDTTCVATVNYPLKNFDADTNAHLIALAPTLLDAIQAIKKETENLDTNIDTLRQTIHTLCVKALSTPVRNTEYRDIKETPNT